MQWDLKESCIETSIGDISYKVWITKYGYVYKIIDGNIEAYNELQKKSIDALYKETRICSSVSKAWEEALYIEEVEISF